MTLKSRLQAELITQGLPSNMAAAYADQLSPILEQTIVNSLPGGYPVVRSNRSAMGAGVSVSTVQARIHAAVPQISANDYGSFQAVSQAIAANPTATEDQIYAIAVKSFLPKSAGGLSLTTAQIAQNVATKKSIMPLVLIGGGVLLAALLLK
jgi:hypothetical protein